MMTQQNVCDERELAKSELRHHVLPLVTCPQVYAQKLIGHKFFVELVSRKCELQDNRAVPVSTQTLDVVVVEPTFQAIEQLLAATGWLKSWQIVSYSKVELYEAPF